MVLLLHVDQPPTVATHRPPITGAEPRSLHGDAYAHVDLDELRLVANGQELTLNFRLMLFRVEHVNWKPMSAERLAGTRAANLTT